MSNFIQISDKYVKFYATTNTSLPDILKNTGALIVVNNANTNLNEMYLADNFIASGRGFLSQEVTDYYSSYANIHPNTNTRELSYILDDLYAEIRNTDSQFTYYVVSDGGNIDNTYITTYDFSHGISEDDPNIRVIHVDDFAKLLKPYEYKDLEICDYTSYILYQISYIVNIDNNTSIVNNWTYKTKCDCSKDGSTVKARLPYGSRLFGVTYSFYTINNSTSGFVDDLSYLTTYTDISYYNGEITNLNYRINQPIGEITDLNIKYHNNGTVHFEKYPDFEYLTSYENMIQPYDHSFSNIEYEGYDIVRYDFSLNKKQHYKDCTNTGTGQFSEIYSVSNDGYSYIAHMYCNQSTDVDDEVRYLYFSIPIDYDIQRVDLSRKYNRTFDTRYFANVTGDVYELFKEDEMQESLQMSYMMIYNDTFVRARYYRLGSKDENDRYLFEMDDIVTVYLIKRETISEETPTPGEDIYGPNTSVVNSSPYFVQNQEYNSTHWFNVDELQYIII